MLLIKFDTDCVQYSPRSLYAKLLSVSQVGIFAVVRSIFSEEKTLQMSLYTT